MHYKFFFRNIWNFDNKSLKGISINKAIKNFTAKSPKAREIQGISVA